MRSVSSLPADFTANAPSAMEDRACSISEMAAQFGVTARALRFYEDQGLMVPARRGQTRLYYGRDRARLAFLLRAKRLGLALAEIKRILDVEALGDGQQPLMRAARAILLEQVARLRAQRIDIDVTLAQLLESLERIEQRLSAPALALVFSETAKAYDAQARRLLDAN